MRWSRYHRPADGSPVQLGSQSGNTPFLVGHSETPVTPDPRSLCPTSRSALQGHGPPRQPMAQHGQTQNCTSALMPCIGISHQLFNCPASNATKHVPCWQRTARADEPSPLCQNILHIHCSSSSSLSRTGTSWCGDDSQPRGEASPDSLQACGHFTGVPCTGNICQRLTSSVTPSPTACTQRRVCSHLRLLSTFSPRPFHTYGLFPWCDLAASSEEQQLFFPLQQAITISCMAQGAHDPPQPAASTSVLPGAN